ncbi:Cell division septum initiation DivIVA, interacts with FtsZ, MinD [Actinopolyspora saharensis]|uniref:Cell division septum initiation DivIVA, interacts with FtsZ, MinD n=1 Tax=Actinopolyspora saharensis TaxID=995062 RepID=A0A1H1FRM9_9ACTN|nr:Cell division septum initiation DivIVA, interacts with FtsZ, MinD [Actinopolyspora saharensis]
MSSVPQMCYISQALQLRANMAGSADAESLPSPVWKATERVRKSAEVFRDLSSEIDAALKKAEQAHTGRAAESANASIAEIKPIAENAAQTADEINTKLAEQNQNQHETFNTLPARGGRLSDGRATQMEPPDKNWAERNGVDNIPGLGWTSDYEDKQARFQATNDEAEQAMSRYNSQTANTTQAVPEFKPPDDSGRTGSDQGDYGQGAGEIMDGTSYGSGSGSAGTSSAWASAPSGAGAGAGAGAAGSYASSGSNAAASPAGTGSAWSTPPGTVRGPDGTLYRQGPDGSWQRQNPYNGRWAPAPQGPPGGAASGGGARGGGAAPRGGASAGGRAGGGFGPRGSGSSELAPGGRSGTGSFGPKGSGTTPTTAGGGASGGGRGNGMMRGAGGAGGAQQGGEEEEHERPSWLMETEDVFTNDMQRVAPPVIGETPYEQGN